MYPRYLAKNIFYLCKKIGGKYPLYVYKGKRFFPEYIRHMQQDIIANNLYVFSFLVRFVFLLSFVYVS